MSVSITLTVRVEPGATLEHVAGAIINMAEKLGCNVECEFQEAILHATPFGRAQRLIEQYRAAGERERPGKVVCAS